MDKTFRQQGSGVQQPGAFWFGLQIISRIRYWLAGFVRLTEDEQKDAGICIGCMEDTRDTWSDDLS